MLKVLLIPWAEWIGWPMQGPRLLPGMGLPACKCTAEGSKGSIRALTERRDRRAAHHQRKWTLKMPVTALHLWAGCSQGALFPSTGQISSDFLKNVCFLLEASQGHRALLCLGALLGPLSFFPHLPLSWVLLCWALSYNHACLMLLTSAGLGRNLNY